MRLFILSASLAVLLSACASGPTGESAGGNVEVLSLANGQALNGAECTVTTAAGQWRVTTPGVAPVGSPAGDLRVLCNKAGYRSSEVVYRPSPQGLMGNPNVGIGIGGGSGNVGVGFGFNLPVGRSQAVGGYPARVAVEMQPQ